MEDDIRTMHAEGLNNSHIASILNIDRKEVGKIVKSLGLSPNKGGKTIIHVDRENVQCTKCATILPRKDLPWGRVTNNPYQLSYCRRCLTRSAVSNIKKDIGQYLNHRHRAIKARALKDGVEFSLPPGYLFELFEKQDGKCFYTDIELKMYFGSGRPGSRADSISVDKIIPERGYVVGNVVLCASRINAIKNDCSLDEMRLWMPTWYARLEAHLEEGN